tara:strand:+ start:3774 stop:4451 length:678 start_codon:yes stop_codon:yes gene_type:complete
MRNNSIHTRLLAGDSQTLSAHELLEALLEFGAQKNINASRRARFFIQRFGTLGDVIAEDTDVLLESRHIDESVVVLFRLVHAIAIHLTREEAKSRDIISSPDALIDYFKVSLSSLKRERFVALLLDAKNALIKEITLDGTINHAPVYPREIARQALALNAISIILVHNHPSGDPHPSLADIQMTDKIASICHSVGVRVIDHFIIGRSRYTSFHQSGLMRKFDEEN